jgi:hypothetical protein
MQNTTVSSVVSKVKKSTESDIKIINKQIYAYTLTRSFSDFTLVNVIAVDKKGELLAVVEADVSFEQGADMVEALNSELKVKS